MEYLFLTCLPQMWSGEHALFDISLSSSFQSYVVKGENTRQKWNLEITGSYVGKLIPVT
jgi:hypothetical protein